MRYFPCNLYLPEYYWLMNLMYWFMVSWYLSTFLLLCLIYFLPFLIKFIDDITVLCFIYCSMLSRQSCSAGFLNVLCWDCWCRVANREGRMEAARYTDKMRVLTVGINKGSNIFSSQEHSPYNSKRKQSIIKQSQSIFGNMKICTV